MSLEPLARAVLYVSLMFIVGLPIGMVTVSLPTYRQFDADARAVLESTKRGLTAACLGLVAGATLLFIAQVIPLELEFSSIEEWMDFIQRSLLGQMWIVRLALGLAAVLTLRLAMSPATWLGSCAMIGLAAQATITRTSHSAAMDAGWIPIATDFAHLFAGGLWGGGLIALLTATRHALHGEPITSVEMTRVLIGRFSSLGIVGVALAIGTGIGLSSLHVTDAEAMRSSHYGQLILLKTVLVAGAVALAVLHKFFTWRGMKSQANVRRFVHTLLVEIMLVIGTFASAALLTSTSPPHHVIAHQMPDGSTHMMLMTDPGFQRTLQIAASAILAAGAIAFALEWRARFKTRTTR